MQKKDTSLGNNQDNKTDTRKQIINNPRLCQVTGTRQHKQRGCNNNINNDNN